MQHTVVQAVLLPPPETHNAGTHATSCQQAH